MPQGRHFPMPSFPKGSHGRACLGHNGMDSFRRASVCRLDELRQGHARGRRRQPDPRIHVEAAAHGRGGKPRPAMHRRRRERHRLCRALVHMQLGDTDGAAGRRQADRDLTPASGLPTRWAPLGRIPASAPRRRPSARSSRQSRSAPTRCPAPQPRASGRSAARRRSALRSRSSVATPFRSSSPLRTHHAVGGKALGKAGCPVILS